MNSERWERLQELYAAARGLPPRDRDAYLREACGDDDELRREAEDLLTATPPDDFVEAPARAEELFGFGLEERRLGDFRLLREIGRGGMGVVYLAVQESLGRRVAVKILPSVKRDPRSLERFAREVRAASSLDHPHVVQVLATGETSKLAWYAMAYVDGHDLAEELKRQRDGGRTLLPKHGSPEYVPRVAGLAANLADALQAAHDAGVVHRDIKPSNVLLDRHGSARLSDFGIARDERFGTMTSTGAVQGTPHYMSPEQAHSLDARVDHRTDVYSLCVVLYEMLTLRRAFDGRTSREVLDKIATRVPLPLRRFNPEVARDLAVICEKGMSKRPADRYATVGELADDLRRFLAFQAIRAKPPGIGQRLAARLRQRIRPVLVGAAVVAAMLVGFAVSEHRSVQAGYDADRAALRAVLDVERWADLDPARLLDASERLRRLKEAEPQSAPQPLLTEVEQRLDAHRTELLERSRELHAAGLGGLDTGTDGLVTPPDLGLLQRSVAEAIAGTMLFPSDAELAELADVRSLFPRVAVRLSDDIAAAFGPSAGRVLLFAFDRRTGRYGDPTELGTTPVRNAPVPSGAYRIVVEIDGFGASELSRTLEPVPDLTEVVAHVRSFAELAADMVPIPAGSVVHPEDTHCCFPAGAISELAGFLIDPTEVSNGEFFDYLQATGAEPPKVWIELGYVTSWRDLPIEDVGERWLRLPVVGVSYFDALAYAEWSGKRLPTHAELERAHRGPTLEQLWSGGLANVGGQLADAEGTLETQYRVYLANTLPVDEPGYRQEPSGLFHAYGNVHELTDGAVAKARAGRQVFDDWTRYGLGGAWDAELRGQTLASHVLREISPGFRSMRNGFRCALSNPPLGRR